MRVAMVSEHASPLAVLGGVDAGGQNAHVAALGLAMARRGVEVTVYTRRDDASLPPRVAMAPRLTVVHVDAGPARVISKDSMLPYMDAFADQMAAAWRRDPPDLVHAHFWMSGKAALRAARGRGIPVIHTFHALGVVKRRYQGARDTSPRQRLALEERIARTVDHIVATCTDEVFELVRLHADRRRISVIPCGVDLELFRPDGPAEARHPERSRLVVVSRLVERKGIEDVIRALTRLPDTELIIAGGPDRPRLWDDPEACRLRAIVEELDLGERVHFRGGLARSAVPPLLRSADAVVSVPWYEPFGIVPVEAMACGVPVVGAAVGGLIDTVVDGLTGVHVKPRDPGQLARVLADLLPDDDLRRAMGRAGVERARAKYGHDQVAQATLETYRRVLDERQAEPLRAAR